jgi:hypothetical protein
MSHRFSFSRRIFIAIAIAVPLAYTDQAKIVSFTVTPRKVHSGESVTLKWVTTGMRKVTLDWAPAENTRNNWQHRTDLPAEGSLTMTPEMNTIYVLTCEDGSGPACASATVRVETIP